MLSYLQNLTFLMLKKASGASIENDPATLRIVETRTVLERMRPIEIKLKYHIDKLIKASVTDSKTASSDQQDPLSFRPNPDQVRLLFETMRKHFIARLVGKFTERKIVQLIV